LGSPPRGIREGQRIRRTICNTRQGHDLATLTFTNRTDKPPFKHKADELNALPVVFIGDSNHAVTPFAGNGANMALKDGWDLADQLVTSDSLETAISKLDSLSFPRSSLTLKISYY